MVIERGYKKTEVGVIPKDWDVHSLEEFAQVIMGQSPVGSSYNKREVGIALINGPTEFTDRYPIKKQWTSSPTKLSEVGDILLCVRGSSTGRINISNDLYCIGRGVAAIRAKENSDGRFLEYAVQAIVKKILNLTAGSTFPNIDGNSIRKIFYPLPKLHEQRAIATALSNVDALLASLDALIAKKRLIRQGTMQELLTGRRRLPGFSEEWEMRKLGDFASLQRGFDLPSSQLREGPYPVVYSNGILNHHLHYMVKAPGVITGRSGTIGKVSYVTSNYWPHNTTLWVTNFKSNHPKFVYYLYSFIGLDRFGTGSGVPTLNRNDVHSFRCLVPSDPKEQEEIASLLSDIDAEISVLEKEHDKTRLLKQGMMQELLTGRTRLNHD